MSISISPAITTTPALDSLFPIYWEDLTDEQKQNGVNIVAYVGSDVIKVGDEYTITVTPTDDLYAGIISGTPQFGNKGESASFTVTASADDNLGFTLIAVDNTAFEAATIALAANCAIQFE